MTSQVLVYDKDMFPDAFETEDGVHLPFVADFTKKSSPRIIKRRARKGTGKGKKRSLDETNKKPNYLPMDNVAPKEQDRANIYYFDILAKKGTDGMAGVPGQNSAYVKQGLEMIIHSGLLKNNGIKSLRIWSDGCLILSISRFLPFLISIPFSYFRFQRCGKHFKTYNHLWFISSLKETCGLDEVIRYFLPPSLSYNICDSHFSHIKKKVPFPSLSLITSPSSSSSFSNYFPQTEQAVRDYHAPQTIECVAFLCTRCLILSSKLLRFIMI
jgi:hypothetical protein